MRLLVMDNGKKNIYSVYEIIDLFYDEDLLTLAFQTIDNYYFYIPDINIGLFNVLCEQLVREGYLDLSIYGEIQDFEGNELEE